MVAQTLVNRPRRAVVKNYGWAVAVVDITSERRYAGHHHFLHLDQNDGHRLQFVPAVRLVTQPSCLQTGITKEPSLFAVSADL